MNVNDFEHVEIPEGDMLSGIFDGQRELMERYHDIEKDRGFIVIDEKHLGQIDSRFVQQRIKDLAYRAIEELGEATNLLKNRPHKTSEVTTDAVHLYEELGDFLHYSIELFITAGMTAEDLAKVYHRKRAVNVFRQNSGY